MASALYEQAGGLDGLRRLCTAFYARVLEDELLKPVFAHFTPMHTEHIAVWLAEVFGGPAGYTAELGGHQGLLRAHLGLQITEAHRQRWLELMDDTIRDTFPRRKELRQVLMGYFDWGTTIARDVSQEPVGTDLGQPGPTPRWGMDGLIG